MNKIICTITSLILALGIGTAEAAESIYYKHSLGASAGKGKPHSLSGFRFHYRNTPIQCSWFEFGLEASYARWNVKYFTNNRLEVFALAPVIRANLFSFGQEQFFLEGSVGPAKRSTKQLADRRAGSKWTFQDIIGFGFTVLRQKLDFRIQYTHYSNANLARPNPGTEVIPMLTLSYRFN